MSDMSQEELRRMHPGPSNVPQRPDERDGGYAERLTRLNDALVAEHAATDAWGAALSGNGFCAGDFGYESPYCSETDNDCCLDCWREALRVFQPTGDDMTAPLTPKRRKETGDQ